MLVSVMLRQHAHRGGYVADSLHQGIARHPSKAFERADLRQRGGEVDDVLADGVPFGVIAVQQRSASVTLDYLRELPAEVERVLHAGVHALTARGAVDVGSVTGEKHSPMTVFGHLAVVDLEAGDPVRSGDGDAADTFVDDLLQLRGGGVLV